MGNKDRDEVELVRPKDVTVAERLYQQLTSFGSQEHPLLGIALKEQRDAFVEQLIESIRRIQYVSVISERKLSCLRADPSSTYFDPLKAAILFKRKRHIDEAFWMVFLFVYFGKNQQTGWRLARDIYGSLGSGEYWNWARISSEFEKFRNWFADNENKLRGGDGIARKFGNHRKYETLKISSTRSTIHAFESYISWVNPPRTHQELFGNAQLQATGNSRLAFDYLYRSINDVISYGRTASFDYLTMIGKIGLASIQPGSTYMQGATGPQQGANLLFSGSVSLALSSSDLENLLGKLEAKLDTGEFGMQVLEDALCNWQKSPNKFKPFRG